MFFGIPQTYLIDIYEFYFEEYMLGYLVCYAVPTKRIWGTGQTFTVTTRIFTSSHTYVVLYQALVRIRPHLCEMLLAFGSEILYLYSLAYPPVHSH